MKKKLTSNLLILLLPLLFLGCSSSSDSGDSVDDSNPPPTNNASPTISGGTDQNISENTSTPLVNFTINDDDTLLNCSLHLSLLSSNSSLIDSSDVIFSGTAPDCTATFTPNLNSAGNATLTVVVSDGFLTDQINLNLTVNRVLVLNGNSYELSNGRHTTSCLNYLNNIAYNNEGDASYWIDPDGLGGSAPIEALCDMTSNGGGWTLLANRSGGTVNTETCGSNLNDFFQNSCGSINDISFSDSYNIGGASTRAAIVSEGYWKFLNYDSLGNLEQDDAYIIHNNGADLFPNSTGVVNNQSVSSICDYNNANCDSTGVVFKWVGDRFFNAGLCSSGYYTGGSLTELMGVYGYCHNGLTGLANSLYGNRSEYQSLKVWGHSSPSAIYQERIWVR